MSDAAGPVPMKDILARATAGLGIDAPVDAGRVWRRWPEIVGDAIARHSEPTSLRKGVLRVRADSPAWCTEVGYLADGIRGRVNEVLGRAVVVEVRVWWAPGPIKSPPRPLAGPVSTASEGRDESSAGASGDDPIAAFERAHNAWRSMRDGRSPRARG